VTAERPRRERLWTVPYVTAVATTALIFISLGITILVLPFFVTGTLDAGESAVGLVLAADAGIGGAVSPGARLAR
jgi:hypothetical protein